MDAIVEDEQLGGRARVVYAAGVLARKIHAGQTDKGGNDYFTSHLLRVAGYGRDWKEKVIGFLHDASEDTPITVPEIMERLKEEVDAISCNSGESFQPLTDEEQREIMDTLSLLNHHNAPSREEYISAICKSPLAIKVKLNDLRSNMDITRIPNPTQKDLARLQRYQAEAQRLELCLVGSGQCEVHSVKCEV